MAKAYLVNTREQRGADRPRSRLDMAAEGNARNRDVEGRWKEPRWLGVGAQTPESTGFLCLAGLSYALAPLGLLAPRRRWRGWVGAYARGQGGSYVALVSALLVVSVDGSAALAAWLLPIVGHPLIERRVAWLEARERAERPPAPGDARPGVV